ncbi:hypothetical protein FT663_04194 [Candidozyma haemuli var. vulneris]|uniref:Uncharacterized protein n=1 Tax=Candidozyma haemuli TaxID=45357 RepID=A0A2V1ALG8_9ASCO|nr:hypothetical protein CXQ85_000963 [[Candida] haemuloni]KAF3986856.1 hypothetical protein FT662_04321 [[Candida] haemuloni var. vulneris]KAF3988072.1 hypothetical protein FT663_04194 [[Candida] haemuloni var. vulneris]PVH18678.1 hypothetical protein CXQ85_000963 [[Candida] haemuloni]
MDAKEIFAWRAHDDTWILQLLHFPQVSGGSFVASTSSGGLVLFSTGQFSQAPIYSNEKAHESSINSIAKVNDTVFVSASTDGLKVWDLEKGLGKPVAAFTNSKNSNFLSVASSPDGKLVAGGTELAGVDAELHIWDWKSQELVRSLVDSHHDDITDIKFHPTMTQYLMSGSTDGYVNIYDLREEDEDEALHQVINYNSVHTCNFIREKRISVLSHMETLLFSELNNVDYENPEEPQPSDIGDLRVWPHCEYVIEVSPLGYAAFGANSESSLSVMPFDCESENFDKSSIVSFPGAHGEEVVRDVLLVPQSKLVITCGEDGGIKAWELPIELQGTQAAKPAKTEIKKDKKDKKDKKKKDKDSKKKKSKKDKKDKRGKDARFKPY